jgi:WS/DGAT/MGAT family acyltransferase
MPGANYDRLTQLDNSFLILETENAHMHVAALQIFESRPLEGGHGSVDIEALRAYIQSRLHLIPRYRQRLVYTPIEGHPVWVDDANFNIRYHVRHTALPVPGDQGQLKRLAARIMSQKLDRGKPLWEIWVIEGLADGRCALVSKTHHCVIDGISGVDIMNVLMDGSPNDASGEAPAWHPHSEPGALELMRDAIISRAALPLDLLKSVPDGMGDLVEQAGALAQTMFASFRGAESTPFNGEIGPHRRFEYTSIDLAEAKAVKRELGGTLNDVVLATVTGAVRKFMEFRRAAGTEVPFRILAPVSVRSAEERGRFGNRVVAWFVDLPVGEANPREVVAQIATTTHELKQSKQALGAEVLTTASEWTGSTLLQLGARLAKRTLAFNMVVTNVPGPQVPLYLLGARMLEAYPMVPLFLNQGLGLALFSYAGRLYWGVNADWDLLPDVERFTAYLGEAFSELKGAAGLPAAGATAKGSSNRETSPRAG